MAAHVDPVVAILQIACTSQPNTLSIGLGQVSCACYPGSSFTRMMESVREDYARIDRSDHGGSFVRAKFAKQRFPEQFGDSCHIAVLRRQPEALHATIFQLFQLA